MKEYFLGLKTHEHYSLERRLGRNNILEEIVELSFTKIIPTILTGAGIYYWIQHAHPHTPANLIIAGEIMRLMCYKIKK